MHGQPAVQAAFIRPDATHTSYLTGVVWMSGKLLRFNLHPGYDEPGGTWPVPDWIPPGQRRGLAATWNGAFRLSDAHGGFYLDGKTAGTLVKGSAAEVFHRDGTMTVGSWGREVHMSPDVVGVRQNLGLLIDHGKVTPNVNSNRQFNWGLTLGGAYDVFRSGVGVTRQGDVLYASGDALSAQTLARVLKGAGCVRAMELDINPAWISFMSYPAGGTSANPTPKSLLPDYQRPANRYYEHTSRDFVTAYAR
ncbi:MAG: phosphodiester glycosidase family protein [Nocardioidaceae bacterium]